MRGIIRYFKQVIFGVKSLLKGMAVTGHYFTHPNEIITQQYPENRDTLKLPKRFRGEVIMPHNEKNEHKCTGCTACDVACPNGSIEIISKWEMTEDGKKKKALDEFIYHLQMCTMCNLCIIACPTDALEMSNDFEHAVFDRSKLTKILNEPNSKLMPGIK